MSIRRYQALEHGTTDSEQPAGADLSSWEKAALAAGGDPNELLTILNPEGKDMTMQDTQTFGQWLRQRRAQELNGISLRDIAEGSGISHTTIYFYEEDRSLPIDSTIPLVARAYRLPVADVRKAVLEARQKRSSADLKVPEKFRSLSPKAWRTLLDFGEMLLEQQREARNETPEAGD